MLFKVQYAKRKDGWGDRVRCPKFNTMEELIEYVDSEAHRRAWEMLDNLKLNNRASGGF